MQINGQELSRDYFEYALWRKIDEHNREAIENGDNEQIIHTTYSRTKRRNMGDFSQMNNGQFKQAVQAAFKDYGLVIDNDDLANSYTAFTNMLNFGQNNMQQLRQNGETNVKGTMPLSPYDPRVANLGIVLDNGSRLGGVNTDDLRSASDLNDWHRLAGINYLSNLHYDEGRDDFVGRVTNESLFGVDDVTGMARLRRYMTRDEYNQVDSWVNGDLDLSQISDQDLATYQHMTDKAEYILRGLRKEGWEYSVQKDSKMGQIETVVQPVGVKVRLTDQLENAEYIGRTFNGGVSGTFNATVRNPKSGTYKVDVTPEQSFDLVRAALGENPKIRDANGNETKFSIGKSLIMKRMIRGQVQKYNATYHANGNLTMVAGPYLDEQGQPDVYHNAVRMYFNTSAIEHKKAPFYDSEGAEQYLQTAVQTARDNFAKRVDVDSLIEGAKKFADDPDYEPEFDADPTVSSVQEAVWDELTTPSGSISKPVMLKPGFKQSDVENYLAQHEDDDYDTIQEGLDKYIINDTRVPETAVKQYVALSQDYLIGQYDLTKDAKTGKNVRFDPSQVVKFQTSSAGSFENSRDLVRALKLTNISADELKGDSENLDLIKMHMVKFDDKSATPMQDLKSPFMQSMYREISQSLSDNGVLFKPEDIKIDKNGIVDYKGKMAAHELQINKNGEKYDLKDVHGQLGQIFEPDKNGVLYTHFNSDNNYAIVPGYNATILPQKDGENKTLEERTILTGYKQQMLKDIRYQLRNDLMIEKPDDNVIGDTTNLNRVYHNLYGEHHEPDFLEKYHEQKMPDHILKAMLESEGQKVRYSNVIRDGSTIDAAWRAENFGADLADDNSNDAFNLTGNRNMSVLAKESDGYFDPIASNATTTNQGIVKFLASGATVNDDGSITPGAKEGPESRTSLMNIPEAEFMKYDPFDRQNMVISNWLQAETVTPDVHVAQMTFGGWNQDDGMVVSKKFAEQYKVRDKETGELRSLKAGDKILDMNGNKGVISLVVDPDMDESKALQQDLTKEVAWFKANPKLDVVMAPFSQVSRYNGGTTRQMMRDPEDLVNPETGKTIKAAMGTMPMIVTDKSVDAKTRVYDQQDIRMGKGRKVSAQLAWSLDSKDAKAIMKEAYGRNDSALTNLHEYLNTLGMDIDPYGNLKNDIMSQTMKDRHEIKQPEITYTKNGWVDMNKTTENLANDLNHQGGMMDLPFKIKLANGKETDKLPVLSSYLRSGQDLVDGTTIKHEYTNAYTKIYKDAIKYRDANDRLAELNKLPNLDKKQQRQFDMYSKRVKDMQKDAQEAYNGLSQDVIKRELGDKHNIFKDKIMAHHMPHSATVVWTEDPRLDLDTFGVGPDTAKKMDLKEGDHMLAWRDPALRDGSTRYVKVHIDPRITAVSSNPMIDKSFDGDYDGDSLGFVKLSTKAAQREAQEKFGLKNNLLDYGAGKDKNGNYPLYMQHSLDILVECHDRPELEKRWDKMTKDINDFERQYKDGKINKAQVDIARTHAVEGLNQFSHDVYKNCGNAFIRYNDLQDHLKSVKEACLDTGAKGNVAKFSDYAKWLGANGVKIDEKGQLDLSNIVDKGDTGATRDMQEETMLATAIKSFGTGVAGAYSQRGMMALRNVCPKAVTELTYPVTQAVLQIKHDPAQAKATYSIMKGPLRQLWQGKSMSKDKDGNWHVNYGKDGKPEQATPKEWEANFKEMFNNDLGVKPNTDYIHEVAQAMTQNGQVQSIETLGSMSALDKLAYGKGGFETLQDLAKQNANIFAGKYNQDFAPNSLRENVRQKHLEIAGQKQVQEAVKNNAAINLPSDSQQLTHKAKTFTKSDVRADGQVKTRRQVSEHVVMLNETPVEEEPKHETHLADVDPGVIEQANELENKAQTGESRQL